jgi:uncharacterized protein (TIRG00374 family)
MRIRSEAWRGARFALGLLLSAAGLYLVLRGIDWQVLGPTLSRVHWGWLLAAVAVEMLTLWIGAIRWRWLFWPHYRPQTGRLFAILGVAQLANTVLPGRLGLLVRALLVGSDGEVSRATALTTLAVEKMLEGITLLPVGVLLFWVLDLPDWLRISALLSAGLLLGLGLVVGVGLRWREAFLGWLSERTTGWLLRVSRALLDGLDALRSFRAGWRLWALSIVYWAAVMAVIGLVMRSVGLHVPLGALLALLFVLQIGVRLPSLPGNVGIFEYLGVVTLSAFGVDKTSALGAMLVLHVVMYLPPSLVGVGYLIWTSTGLGQLRRAALSGQEN